VNYELISFWSQIAGFVLFAATLIWAWNKFILPAVDAAQKVGNQRIEVAERHRDEMQKAIAALEHELDGARTDATAIIERARIQSKREHGRTVEEAATAGERAMRNAERELERARMAARAQLRETLAAKALEIARGRASQRIDESVNTTLVQEFVESLGRSTDGK
jgi:F-type H+-transporting ATPase subunit b